MTTTPAYKELQQKVKGLEKKLMTVTRIAKVYQKSEGWLDAVFSANPDPVIVFDEDEHTRHLNPAFSRVFGWTMDELMGQRIHVIPNDQVVISD